MPRAAIFGGARVWVSGCFEFWRLVLPPRIIIPARRTFIWTRPSRENENQLVTGIAYGADLHLQKNLLKCRVCLLRFLRRDILLIHGRTRPKCILHVFVVQNADQEDI